MGYLDLFVLPLDTCLELSVWLGWLFFISDSPLFLVSKMGVLLDLSLNSKQKAPLLLCHFFCNWCLFRRKVIVEISISFSELEVLIVTELLVCQLLFKWVHLFNLHSFLNILASSKTIDPHRITLQPGVSWPRFFLMLDLAKSHLAEMSEDLRSTRTLLK